MISLRCEWCQPTACIILQLEDLGKDDSNLQQALCMSSSHSIAMLQNQHDLKWKDDQFMPKPLLKSIWLHENVGTVAIDGWWWVTIQWEVQRTIYSSRVTGSFQQTSPLLRHLPGILEGGKKKERTIKEPDRAERAKLRLTLRLKASALISSSYFHGLFKREIRCAKRRRIRRARQLLNGNTGCQGKKIRQIIRSDHGDGSNRFILPKGRVKNK